MKCFYHKSDLDGHCAGAIVKYRYPECEMIGVDYRDTMVNLDLGIRRGEKIFVVDFCFDAIDMEDLYRNARLYWIDHHKSSIEIMHRVGINSRGLQSTEKARCELTWKYLFPERDMPRAVRYIGRYDVWDHQIQDVLPFQYGMREGIDTFPEAPIWKCLLEEDLAGTMTSNLVKTGEIILRYQDKQNEMYAKGMAYEAEFEGLRAVVMNKPFANSKAFDAVYKPEKHDIMVLFGVKPGEVKYTLFTDKPEVDVSEIAKKYGGGGHKGAAGFYSKTMVV